MLQRRRSASLPRDIGEFYFIGESDFHSDVYDDSTDDMVPKSEALEPIPVDSNDDVSQSYWNPTVIGKIILVVVSGTVSSVLFEMLLRIDSGAALLSALFLHVWIVVVSIPNGTSYIFSPKIPLYWHFVIVMLSFSFLFLKSFAVQYLPMPILIVCSNLQLVLGLVVGKTLFSKLFSFGQYMGVIIITLGCILITLSSQQSGSSSKTAADLVYGVVFITAAILSIAIMIPTGSMVVQKYGADVQEQIFFQHFLSLPLFAVQWNRLAPCLDRLIHAEQTFDIFGLRIPIVLLLLVGTTVTAQINRYLTMELSINLSPLASQLVNAVNKTLVLLVSMLHFNAPPYPNLYVWIGVLIQTVGSVMYVQNSYSDTSGGNFKPNKRKSRFSRVSWTGSRIDLSPQDIERLRGIAEVSRRKKVHKSASDPHMDRPRDRGIVASSHSSDDDSSVASPDARTRRPAFSSRADTTKKSN